MSRTAWLLDVNVLIALTHEAHVHHALAQAWLRRHVSFWASCTVTQLGFVRVASTTAVGGPDASPQAALAMLDEMLQHAGHVFWVDKGGLLQMDSLRSPMVVGPRQVGDAYLLGLAAQQRSKLVTLDRSLVALAQAQQLDEHLHWIGPEAVSTPAAYDTPARTAAAKRRR